MNEIMNNEKPEKKLYPTILVCIDTTNASEVALRYACYKSKITGFPVEILAVIETSHKNLLFGSKAIGNEKREILEKHIEKLINTVCQETGIIPSVSIREGEIASEIIAEVKSTPFCAMLILGKSKDSQSDNTVLPKIAQKIGVKINIPITIVPENLSNDFLKKLL